MSEGGPYLELYAPAGERRRLDYARSAAATARQFQAHLDSRARPHIAAALQRQAIADRPLPAPSLQSPAAALDTRQSQAPKTQVAHTRVRLRGYAAPFNVEGLVRGRVRERIAPRAFQFDNPVELQLGHGGPVLASLAEGTLRLWQDFHGLGFDASVREDPETIERLRKEGFRASVRFAERADGGIDWEEDPPLLRPPESRRIRRARIDHIALVRSAAYGDATGAWLVEEQGRLQHPHLRKLAAIWWDNTYPERRS